MLIKPKVSQQTDMDMYKDIILSEQTSLLYAAVNKALLATFINSIILAFVLWGTIDQSIILGWLVALGLVSVGRAILVYSYNASDIAVIDKPRWYRRFIVGSLMASLVWGSASFFLFATDNIALQVFLAFVVGGMAAGATTSLSFKKFAVNSYLAITLLPLAIHFIVTGRVLGLAMGMMLLVYFAMLFVSASQTFESTLRNILLKIKNTSQEESLKVSEERYKKLLETATDAFFLHDISGKFYEVNERACLSLGYTQGELLGMSVTDVEMNVTQETLAELLTDFKAEDVLNFEGSHRRKDGSTFPVELSVGVVHMDDKEYFSVLARDISDRKQAEAAINDSQQRMALHVQHTPLGVIEWDENFCVTEWNPAAEIIFGYKKDEVLGLSAHEIILSDNAIPDVDKIWGQLLNSEGGMRSTNENVNKAGDTILCEWYNTPLVSMSEKVFGVASLVQDITKRVSMEESLIKAKTEAEKANEAKSEFLSKMSHELRTPLNAILGFGQLLEAEADDENNKQQLREILNAGDHLLELINEILDLSRIESGKLEVYQEEVDLGPVMDEVLSLIGPVASKESIDVVSDLSASKGVYVNADHTRLKQVLLNLLSNAIKYNRAQGRVTINMVLKDKSIRINISDEGNGLSKTQQDMLFKPFSRLDKHKDIQGTGIGLVISKSLIEMMNGEIGVISEEGAGTTFWIEIPLAVNVVPKKEKAASNTGEATDIRKNKQTATQNKTILYIEDNPANMKLVAHIVDNYTPHKLIGAANALQGISIAEEQQPDMILMDIDLPDINGYEAFEKLQQKESTNHIPVIAVSANAMLRDIEKGKAVGFKNYLTKPLNVQDFVKVVENILS